MWPRGSAVFLVTGLVIGIRLLFGNSQRSVSGGVVSGEWSDKAYGHSPDLRRERGRFALPLVSEERYVGKNSCTPGVYPTRLASTPAPRPPLARNAFRPAPCSPPSFRPEGHAPVSWLRPCPLRPAR